MPATSKVASSSRGKPAAKSAISSFLKKKIFLFFAPVAPVADSTTKSIPQRSGAGTRTTLGHLNAKIDLNHGQSSPLQSGWLLAPMWAGRTSDHRSVQSLQKQTSSGTTKSRPGSSWEIGQVMGLQVEPFRTARAARIGILLPSNRRETQQ